LLRDGDTSFEPTYSLSHTCRQSLYIARKDTTASNILPPNLIFLPLDDTKVAMTSSSSTDYSDLVQIAESSHKIQRLAEDLTRYFNPKDIVAANYFAKVECTDDETKVLDEVKEEFKREFRKSKKVITNLLIKTYTN
jgi:hypothetical protein